MNRVSRLAGVLAALALTSGLTIGVTETATPSLSFSSSAIPATNFSTGTSAKRSSILGLVPISPAGDVAPA
jgi:hypothetical protein